MAPHYDDWLSALGLWDNPSHTWQLILEGLPRLAPDGRWLLTTRSARKSTSSAFRRRVASVRFQRTEHVSPSGVMTAANFTSIAPTKRLRPSTFRPARSFSAGVPIPIRSSTEYRKYQFFVEQKRRFLLPALTDENFAAPMSMIFNWPRC